MSNGFQLDTQALGLTDEEVAGEEQQAELQPIPDDVVAQEDNPITPGVVNMNRMDAAAMRSKREGIDIISAYAKNMQEYEDSVRAASTNADQNIQVAEGEVTEATQQLIHGGADLNEGLEIAMAAQEVMGEVRETKYDPHKAIRMGVQAMVGPEAGKVDVEQMEATRIMASQLTSYMESEVGSGLEKVGEIAGLLGVAVLGLPETKALMAMGINPLTAEEDVRNMIVNFRALPPQDQVKLFPVFLKDAADAFDNDILAVSFMSKFLEPGAEWDTSEFSKFWVALSGADQLGLLFGMGKAAKGIKAYSMQTRLAAKLENLKQASETATAAVVDESGSAAKATGYPDRTTAANDALPGGHHIDPNSTPTVAAPVGETLENHHQSAFAQLVGQTVQGIIDKAGQVKIGAYSSQELAELAADAGGDIRKAVYGEAHARGLDVLDFKIIEADETGMTYELLVKPRATEANLSVTDDVIDLSGETRAVSLTVQRKLVSNKITQRLQTLKDPKKLEEAGQKMFPGVPNAAEKARKAINNEIEELKGLLDEYTTELEGIKLTDDEVKRAGEFGVGIQYSKEIEGSVVETKTVKFKLDQVNGTLGIEDSTVKSPILSAIRSPLSNATTKQVKKLVKQAIIYDGISAKVAQELTALHKLAYQPLGHVFSKQRRISEQRIDAVLRAGDEAPDSLGNEIGTEWTVEELRNGIPVTDRKTGGDKLKGLDDGDGTIKLNDTEIEVYYNLRNLYDKIYDIKDAGVRRELEMRGFKNIRIPFWADEVDEAASAQMGTTISTRVRNTSEKNFGQPMDTPDRAKGAVGDEKVYFGEEDMAKALHELDLDELYEQGYKVVRLHDKSLHGVGKKKYKFVLVKTDDIGELPSHVLHRKAGYVPRVYEQGLYFVKKFDADGKFENTVRQFDNSKEAEEFTRAQNAQWAARNGSTVEEMVRNGVDLPYKNLEDRQMNSMDLMMESIGGSGGMYNSPRAAQAIPFGKEGTAGTEKARRLNSHQALAQMINHVSIHYPRNEWRLAMEQKLKNSIEKIPGAEYRGVYEPVVGTSEQAKNAERMRQNMLTWLHIQDPSERSWQHLNTRLYEWAVDGGDFRDFRKDAGLFGNVRTGVGKGAWWLRSTDPATAIRAQAFHAMLGWFNPVQLWVQAQGASLAVSIAGKDAPKIFGEQFLLRGIYYLDNPEALAQTAKRAGMDLEDMIGMREAYRKSGLQEGIDTTADFVASESGWAHGISGFKEFADKGLFAYRAGEGFNRRFSFLTAMREHLNATGKTAKQLTDDDIIEITARANDFMLNLGRANRASWQVGWTSVPTQFMQVNAKMIETLLGKEFTFSEKLRILLGQTALYGTAGLPAGTFINNMVNGSARAYGVQPEGDEGFSAVTKELLDQGAWGVMFNSILGMDVTVAKRGAILSGVEDTLLNLFFRDAAISDVILGAGGSYLDRILTGTKDIASMSLARLSNPRTFEKEDVYRFLHNISSITSTSNSLEKAFLMDRLGQLRTSKGTLIAEDDFTFMEKMGAFLGLQPKEISNYYAMKSSGMLHTYMKSRATSRIVDLYVRYATIYNSGDSLTDEQVENIQLEIQGWLSIYNEYGKAEIMNAVQKKLLDEPGVNKEFRKFIKNKASLSTDSLRETMSRGQVRDPKGI